LGEHFSALGGDEETVRAFTAVTLGDGLPIIVAGGLIGQAAGKVAGVPRRKLTTADDALDRALAESDMQEQLRTQVRQLVGERSGGRVVLVKKPLPEGVGPEFARLSCVRCGTLAWLQELAAVLACSDRRYLPDHYRDADRAALMEQFAGLKLRAGRG